MEPYSVMVGGLGRYEPPPGIPRGGFFGMNLDTTIAIIAVIAFLFILKLKG